MNTHTWSQLLLAHCRSLTPEPRRTRALGVGRSAIRLLTRVLSSSIIACAHAGGTEPHDLSAVGHEQRAEQEDQTALRHEQQSVDPLADPARHEHCDDDNPTNDGRACWTTIINPSEEHAMQAEWHRRAAEAHRAASNALRDAEASACQGIAVPDRDMSPFAQREDVRTVTATIEGAGPDQCLVGATVVFRSVPKMTAEWLQRSVDCHIARNAALGFPSDEMEYCPLALPGVTAVVTAVTDGYAVALRTEDPATAELVLGRARALVGESTASK